MEVFYALLSCLEFIYALRIEVGEVLEMVGIDVGLVVRRPDGLLYQRFTDVSGGEPDENVRTNTANTYQFYRL